MSSWYSGAALRATKFFLYLEKIACCSGLSLGSTFSKMFSVLVYGEFCEIPGFTELDTHHTPFARARALMGETAICRGHNSLHTMGSHDCGSATLRMEDVVQNRASECSGKFGIWNTTHGLVSVVSQSTARGLNTAWEDLDDDASDRGVHARELGVDTDVGVVHVNLSHGVVSSGRVSNTFWRCQLGHTRCHDARTSTVSEPPR